MFSTWQQFSKKNNKSFTVSYELQTDFFSQPTLVEM